MSIETPNHQDERASETVVNYVLRRLAEIGISDVFGVAGDFAFPIQDAICTRKDMRWMGCCNELNAAYAADGYARIKGIAAISTTYGVGELSAISAIAGSYAENLPIFHLVGMPSVSLQESRAKVHHTLGNGEFNLFARMTEPVVCAHAILTPQNAVFETERLIAAALYHRRPVYMALPADTADQSVVTAMSPIPMPGSDRLLLDQAVAAIVSSLEKAQNACILPGILVARAGLQREMQAVVDASGLPYATMYSDKTVLDERQDAYVGMYCGKLINEEVREFVESCDWILGVGTMPTDFNTGAFTARLNHDTTIHIDLHTTRVGQKSFPNVQMRDMLANLAARITKRKAASFPRAGSLAPTFGEAPDPITAGNLYPRWERFLRSSDILIAETGTVAMGLIAAHMPEGACFHNQSLWGAIGWATPAAFGASVAARDRRLVLITGEGAHQLTVQEISQFAREKLRPVVFVLNNNGYLIERLVCKTPEIEYNDIPQWNYGELPHAFGCNDWFTARVTTCEELDRAMEIAANATTGVYIEVVTGMYSAPPLAEKLHESITTLYGR
jgi:indolepyruvate decarboxylase